ncbi:MAG: gas vesicle protein [Candidatus Aenigmarchaeota archaeon]|nr:gas vesicle protein [Candidatus Aenigmarchaeota archaeon]
MEPKRDLNYKLVDLLNAILDTGVVINADVVITLSGIPLIGINLRAAIAGMATMLGYGLMEAWDENVRKHYSEEIERKGKNQNNDALKADSQPLVSIAPPQKPSNKEN